MHFSESLTYPAPLAQVNDMLVDPEFLSARYDLGVFTEPQVSASAEGGVVTTVFTSLVDPQALPGAVSRFVKGDTKVTITEVWEAPTDSDRTGTFDVAVTGVPVTIHATSTLAAAGAETTRTIDGDLDVKIPLVGGKLEQKAIGLVPRLLSAEKKAAEAYLAD